MPVKENVINEKTNNNNSNAYGHRWLLQPIEVPREQIVMRNGLAYEVNSQTPFTGIAVDYYENGQLEYKENFKDGRRDGL